MNQSFCTGECWVFCFLLNSDWCSITGCNNCGSFCSFRTIVIAWVWLETSFLKISFAKNNLEKYFHQEIILGNIFPGTPHCTTLLAIHTLVNMLSVFHYSLSFKSNQVVQNNSLEFKAHLNEVVNISGKLPRLFP